MDQTSEPNPEAARPIVVELRRQKTKRRTKPRQDEPRTASGLRPTEDQPRREGRPVVLEYNKPQDKPARRVVERTVEFSPELRDLQVLGTGVVRATHQAASALVKGIDTYERERLRSMQAKKDGALEDFIYNASKAVGAWMKAASDIPLDLSDALRRSDDPKRARQRRRKLARALRRWRE